LPQRFGSDREAGTRFRFRLPWACAAAVLLSSLAVRAAPPTAKEKAVAALLNAALAEHDQGHFDRAAELFLQIWRQDKGQPVALQNAARASQLAGHLERAEELYRKFMALPDIDSVRAAKVKGFVQESQRTKAERKAEGAARAERDGRYDLALARIIHDSFCCKLAFLAPRVFRPRCSLRRTASAPRCAAPRASAIRFGNRAFATKSRE
jgi:tetratricopeptide (TPR) repeat protein